MENNTLDKIFDSPTAKMIDLYPLYGERPFTTSIAANDIDVSFKTALKSITQLESQQILIQVKKIRNAKAYKFNKKSPLLNCLKGLAK